MCVDYTDLNRACPKDAYPLPSIDKLVDNSAGFKLLSFMDAYSGYNQIPMADKDKKYIAFMTSSGNYYYNVMPFGLKKCWGHVPANDEQSLPNRNRRHARSLYERHDRQIPSGNRSHPPLAKRLRPGKEMQNEV